MITNKVVELLEKTRLKNGVVFDKGQEIEIVMDVVYVSGYPLPPEMQAMVLSWINENSKLFKETTRKW